MRGTVPVALMGLIFTVTPLSAAGIEDQEIAFLSRRDGNFEVYLRCRDGRELNLTQNPAQDYGLSWAPAGWRLAFATNRDGNEEIYQLRLGDGALLNLTQNPANDGQPAWSPDGRRIAFFSDREGDTADPLERRELYVLELASNSVRRLTTNSVYEESPAWTADGKGITFCRMRPRPTRAAPSICDLWTIDVETGSEKQLTSREGFSSGASRGLAGLPMLFHGREGTHDIFTLDPANGEVKNLTRDSPQDWQPAWSADGTEIIWCAGLPPKSFDIWVMKADGTERRRLVSNPDRDEWPALRPYGATKGGPCDPNAPPWVRASLPPQP